MTKTFESPGHDIGRKALHVVQLTVHNGTRIVAVQLSLVTPLSIHKHFLSIAAF